jgi:hypothetical protein
MAGYGLLRRDKGERYALAFPHRDQYGAWSVIEALGTRCATRDQAKVLLSDRVANGDAFPGEFIRKLTAMERAP